MNKIDELIKTLGEYKEALKKDGLDDKIKAKIKAKLKAEMGKRNFSEADATRHVIDRDRGTKQPAKPKPLLQTEQELVKFSENGQWNLEKSNEIKPFGENVYDATANIERKKTRTGEERPEIGKNPGVRQYTTSGSTMQQAHEAIQNKEQKAKNKASVRTFADMSEEEKAAIKAKYEQPLKRGIDVVKEALTTGHLPAINKAIPQPSDQQMFGHLVKTEAEIKAAQEHYENRMQKTVEALEKPIDHLNKSEIALSWGYGKSFNSLLKEKLSDKEIAERNAAVYE
jgi:hypothetical protein